MLRTGARSSVSQFLKVCSISKLLEECFLQALCCSAYPLCSVGSTSEPCLECLSVSGSLPLADKLGSARVAAGGAGPSVLRRSPP